LFYKNCKEGTFVVTYFWIPTQKKMRETQNNVVLSGTLLLLLLPLNGQQGKGNFLFISFVSSCLALSLSPLTQALSKLKTQRNPHPLMMKIPGESRPASGSPLATLLGTRAG
jgi:hypothetical protein